MAVLLSMTSVYSVCAAETGIEAAGGSGSISAGAETAFVGNGNILYQPLKITGALMPEEQIFSGKDLNEILEAESLGLTKLQQLSGERDSCGSKGNRSGRVSDDVRRRERRAGGRRDSDFY